MIYLLVNWVLTAVAFLAIAHVVPGFHVTAFAPALIAAIVFGLVNSTLGLLLKVVTFPLTVITFGLFLLVINALMLLLVSAFVSGFEVVGFGSAFLAAILLALLNTLIRHLIFR